MNRPRESPLAGARVAFAVTRVCLLGEDEVDFPRDLLVYETAREALASYDLQEPFANSVAVETVSVGAAVSLLNDLSWYLVRLVEASFVQEPSISESEWLSRDLATEVRNEEREPADTGEFLMVYGLRERDEGPPEILDPMYLRRIDGEIPDYDLYDVEDTLVVRVTEAEFGDG